jgi:hypothetical protein
MVDIIETDATKAPTNFFLKMLFKSVSSGRRLQLIALYKY